MGKVSTQQMEKKPPNKMAEAAAAVRAVHTLHEGAVIFDDPYAMQLTSRGWRMLAKSRLFYGIGVRRVLHVLRPVHGQVLVRSRYSEERLQEAIAAGITQYVILGAGLDSFAWRQPELAAKLRVYELDHPGTQQVKRRRIEDMGLLWPFNLEMMPINFEQETVMGALAQSSFDPTQAAFVSWLGTTPYLTREAIVDTLKSIGEMAAGTELVFDYAEATIPPEEKTAVEKLQKFTERRGERLITQFDATELNQEMDRLGYDIIENRSHATWRPHYYNRPQLVDLRPLTVAHVVHAKVR